MRLKEFRMRVFTHLLHIHCRLFASSFRRLKSGKTQIALRAKRIRRLPITSAHPSVAFYSYRVINRENCCAMTCAMCAPLTDRCSLLSQLGPKGIVRPSTFGVKQVLLSTCLVLTSLLSDLSYSLRFCGLLGRVIFESIPTEIMAL